MATLKDIKKAFFTLSQKEQEIIIKDIYGFSKDMKTFLNICLLDDGGEAYLKEIQKATESQTPKGYPKEISVRTVNSIFTKARKSNIKKDILCEMEWIAFDGYMTYLNDYGGGAEIYEDKMYEHLNSHLLFTIKLYSKEEQKEKFKKISFYLKRHTNGCYDDIFQLFEELTGSVI